MMNLQVNSQSPIILHLHSRRWFFTVPGGKRVLKTMKWGLVPSWTKPETFHSGLINARFETLREKPSFRTRYKTGRCIIPATGYFEWKKEGKRKTPYFINCGRDVDGSFIPMLMCGLYDIWKPGEGAAVETFTIITTEASGPIRDIHERMPLITGISGVKLWLSNDYNPDTGSIIESLNPERLDFYAVTDLVNSPAHNTPECIIPAPL